MQYKMSIEAYFDSPYQIELKHIFVELNTGRPWKIPFSSLKPQNPLLKINLLSKMIKKNEFWSEYQVAEKKLKHPFSSHTFPYNWFWKCREANLKKISHISGCTPARTLGWKVSSTLNLWISFKYQYFGDFMQDKMSIKVFLIAPTRLS